jgi:uncharacterized membrane protein
MHSESKAMTAGTQLVLAAVLFLTPWMAGFAGEQTAAWTAWITSAAVALVAIISLVGHASLAPWINLALGVWAIVAPWVMGFATMAPAMWSHVVLGAAVVLAAAAELWLEHRSPPQVHA